MNAEEQHQRLEEALCSVGADLDVPERAAALYARGVRVLQLDEVIVSRADAKLLELVREASERWEELKARSATVRSDESERTVDVNPETILNALRAHGKPIRLNGLIQKILGRRPGGNVYAEWKTVFAQLVDEGRVRAAPGYENRSFPKWIAVGDLA